MCIAKIIGKIHLTQQDINTLLHLGVSYIATDNPKDRSDEEEIIKRIGNAEAIIINISVHITRNVIQNCRELRFIQTWSTGMDHIHVDAAQTAGILIKNVPDFSVESVAEKTLSMMIFIANKMREANRDGCG
jgi:glycerate dehydrogenase